MSGDAGKDGRKDPVEELGFEASAFESLERDFQEVLADLVGDKSLERFRMEYEKIHRALKKSHDSEKRLIKKCRELNSEIVSNAAKVQTALKLSQEDQSTISALKKEIEKAWKMVDASHEKEARAKETIQQLKQEIFNLSKLVDQGAGLTIGQEQSVQELLKIKEDLTKERDSQMNQIVGLRNEISDYMEKSRKLESDKQVLENEIHTLTDLLATKNAETDRMRRQKERHEKELKETKEDLESRTIEVKTRNIIITQNQQELKDLELRIKEQKALTDKAVKDFDNLNQRNQKLQQDWEEQVHQNTQLEAEVSQRKVEVALKEEEVQRMKQEMMQVDRMRESLQKRVRQMEEKKAEVEKQRDSLKGEIFTLEREIEKHKKAAEMDRKQIEEMQRERDMLNKNLKLKDNATHEQTDLVKIADGQKKNLEMEIAAYKSEAQKQRKVIYTLEKEREKYDSKASEATAKYGQMVEEAKIRDMTIRDLEKKIAEGEAKVKQQQNLYEAVRSDRNLYSKNLVEAQDEIAEMKRKFKIMNHQIEQLKEEISAKEKALHKESMEKQKVEKEKDALQKMLKKLKESNSEADQTINQHKAEIQKLNHIINEADAERWAQKKELDMVINERDILGTQLIRRNDELALLYEKIKIQQSTLNKGEIQYRERLGDIRVLKLKIKELQRELSTQKSNVYNVEALQGEVYRLQRELLQERTKVKALSEELENPMNVHRWRKLEGSDPDAFEMIQKIQTLQKRLIKQTELVVEKDMQIKEKEKLYMDLKKILARQPGPEVAEQLNMYQQSLKEKTRQMKSMASELNMYQAQVNEYNYQLERLSAELVDIKQKYYAQKRSAQRAAEKERRMMEEDGGIRDARPVGQATRFAGGGFNLAQGKLSQTAPQPGP